jgi:hypothetical protein
MRYLLLALAALALLAPAAASAKVVTRAEVCGAVDCVAVTDRGALRALLDVGPPADGPEAPASYYEVRLPLSAGKSSALVYLPSAGRIGTGLAGRYDWFAASPDAAAVLDSAASGLDPLPGPVVRGIPLGRMAAATTTTAGGGFPWAVLVVPACMLGMFGLGWAGRRKAP